MISNYFTSKRKTTNKSVNASKNEVKVGPLKHEVYRKWTYLTAFSKEETPKRVENMEKTKRVMTVKN